MKLTLVHTFGRNAGLTQSFEKPVVKLGRADGNDVVFDAEYDRDASGNHAEIRRVDGGFMVVDVGSRNGTFVAGQRTAQHMLSDGDEVGFGTKGPRIRVSFRRDEESTAKAVAASGTLLEDAPKTEPDPDLARYGGGPTAQAPPPPAPAAIPARPRQPEPQRAHAPAPPAAPQAKPLPLPHPAPPAQAAPPAAPAAGSRVGRRTMAMMISSAVDAATGRSRPQNTREIAAIVEREVHVATGGQRRAMRWLAFATLLLLAGAAALFFWGRKSEDEVTKLRGDLAKLPPGDPRRQEIEGRLGTLHPANASFGRNLYDQSKKGIFMLASGGEGFCTAFAVKPSVLATNAHCARLVSQRAGVVALENEGQGKVSYSVGNPKIHPSYRESDADNITPDVATVTISGKAAVVLTLATTAELASMGVGDDLYLIGFPGRLMDASNPSATFLAAHIGRITDALGRPTTTNSAWLIQHDAPTTRGTSGSPIFNGQGHVVAINAGGYLEGDDQTIAGKKTEVVRESPYKFGMRVDLLGAVLK